MKISHMAIRTSEFVGAQHRDQQIDADSEDEEPEQDGAHRLGSAAFVARRCAWIMSSSIGSEAVRHDRDARRKFATARLRMLHKLFVRPL
ncbi:MAG TPA: hypothetical protein VKM35_04645 [Arenimonas sp.]|nr:hypothetical protein [Arenimonas sp.]HMB56477.1 hypothetical protein [Arenimonas sp.]